MWQKDKRTVLIVLGTLLVLLIWNGYNISSWRGLSAEEEALRTEQEKVGARIHNPDEALSEDQVYIAWAIKKQAEYRKELEEELGAQFTSQVFSIPKAYLPRAGTTSMVFFDEKSGDEKVNLIKKSDVFGFRINTELRFGDADDQNLKECVSMLYLIQRVMNEAIENGLKSLETLRQKPVETLNSRDNTFSFNVYGAQMVFSGKPENILRFLDRFQTWEAGDTMFQKVFPHNIRISAGDPLARLEVDFALIAFKGRNSAVEGAKKTAPGLRKEEKKKQPEMPAAKPGQPLGI